MSDVRYIISDAADKLQLETHVLRYWEDELELDIPRNEMGHRYYTPEWLERFEQIRQLKKQGYQLKAIKMLLHNPNQFAENSSSAAVFPTAQNPNQLTVEDNAIQANLKLEQFQIMMSNIVKNALSENNQDLSEKVGETVLREMNILMQEREQLEEARFRKLDESLRLHQKNSKKKKERCFFKKKTTTHNKYNLKKPAT